MKIDFTYLFLRPFGRLLNLLIWNIIKIKAEKTCEY